MDDGEDLELRRSPPETVYWGYMPALIDIGLILAAVCAFLVAAYLARLAWRLSRTGRDRNARLLNSVYEQQERRRRGD